LAGVDLGLDDLGGDLVGQVADLELGLAEDLAVGPGAEQADHAGEVLGGGLLELAGDAEDVLFVVEAVGLGHDPFVPIVKESFGFQPDASRPAVVRDFPPTIETPTHYCLPVKFLFDRGDEA
jgi:hypothetical protein